MQLKFERQPYKHTNPFFSPSLGLNFSRKIYSVIRLTEKSISVIEVGRVCPRGTDYLQNGVKQTKIALLFNIQTTELKQEKKKQDVKLLSKSDKFKQAS